MAARALPTPPASAPAPKRRARSGIPEIYFPKSIDNSRLVRIADPRRRREMAHFFGAVCVLFLLVMAYGWQHFSAIEYGYRIEAQKAERDRLVELNRALRLEEASLRDPQRIDVLARRMGLVTPEAAQVMRLEPSAAGSSEPVLARAGSSGIAVVTLAP